MGPAEANDQTFSSVAWVLKGLFGSSGPCLLRLAAGRLALICEEGQLFDAPVMEVETVFPRYYFSGGVKLRVGDRKYRLSFVRPTNATRRLGEELADVAAVAGSATDIWSGRKAGKEWKGRLGRV